MSRTMAPSRNFSSHSELSQMALGASELIRVQVFVDGRLEQVNIRCQHFNSHQVCTCADFTCALASVQRHVGLQGGSASLSKDVN